MDFVPQRGGTPGPLIFLIVLDTCMDEEDFQAVKVSIIHVYSNIQQRYIYKIQYYTCTVHVLIRKVSCDFGNLWYSCGTVVLWPSQFEATTNTGEVSPGTRIKCVKIQFHCRKKATLIVIIYNCIHYL